MTNTAPPATTTTTTTTTAAAAMAAVMAQDEKIRGELNAIELARIANFFTEVKDKVKYINQSYGDARRSVEEQFRSVSSAVQAQTEQRHRELSAMELKLQNDVKQRLYEVLFDLRQRYEMNQHVNKFHVDMNKHFEAISSELNASNNKSGSTALSNEQIKSLFERIEALNANIEENRCKLVPARIEHAPLRFTKSERLLELPLIGEINMEATFRFDTITQIRQLNDNFKMSLYDLSGEALFTAPCVTSFMALIAKNKILFLHEKMHGRIRTTSLFVVYYDLSIMHRVELDHHLETLCTCCVHGRTICVAFRRSKGEFLVKLFNAELKLLKENLILFDELDTICMSGTRISLVNSTKSKNCVCELDYSLSVIKRFGQRTSPTRAFYVKGELLAVNDHKVFVRDKQDIRVMSYSTGKLLYKFSIGDLDDKCVVRLDYHTEKFLVFNGYEKLSYYNHEGALIVSNKLRFHEKFDGFQHSLYGNFAFVNCEKKLMLVI